MGTIVQSGSGAGVVVATGPNTEFGRIAVGLGTQQPQTEFQRGLGRFSLLLLEVALVLTTLIFVANLLLHRPLLESLLFSLAIAVGITPQLLPAVVSTSLATGSRALAKREVLVKRLVCIEDLGDLDMLVTDKTGTLTEGRISFTSGIAVDGVEHQRRTSSRWDSRHGDRLFGRGSLDRRPQRPRRRPVGERRCRTDSTRPRIVSSPRCRSTTSAG